MPPVTLPPLPQDERFERLKASSNGAKAQASGETKAANGAAGGRNGTAQDGFLDLDAIDPKAYLVM